MRKAGLICWPDLVKADLGTEREVVVEVDSEEELRRRVQSALALTGFPQVTVTGDGPTGWAGERQLDLDRAYWRRTIRWCVALLGVGAFGIVLAVYTTLEISDRFGILIGFCMILPLMSAGFLPMAGVRFSSRILRIRLVGAANPIAASGPLELRVGVASGQVVTTNLPARYPPVPRTVDRRATDVADGAPVERFVEALLSSARPLQ